VQFGEVHDQKILGDTIDRVAVARRRLAAATQKRFVISRDYAFAAAIGVEYTKGPKHICEKMACDADPVQRNLARRGTHLTPVSARAHSLTALQECFERRRVVIVIPVWQLGPLGGHERRWYCPLCCGRYRWRVGLRGFRRNNAFRRGRRPNNISRCGGLRGRLQRRARGERQGDQDADKWSEQRRLDFSQQHGMPSSATEFLSRPRLTATL
jgi:hypothetical protein